MPNLAQLITCTECNQLRQHYANAHCRECYERLKARQTRAELLAMFGDQRDLDRRHLQPVYT